MHKLLSNRRTIFALVAPGLFLFVFMVCFPIIMSAYYGMTDWRGIGSYQFVGLDNYMKILFDDPVFWRSLMNALLLLAATLLLQHPIALLFSIFVTNAGRFEKLFRTIFFIPAVISIVVTSKMWVSVFHPNYGVLNKFLTAIGLENLKQDWLGDPNIAIWCVIFVIMWQGFGYALLLYYAGLQGIPKDLYEAAELDGAGRFKLYTKVVIPLLRPMVRVAVVIAVTACLKQMETIFLMTNGGPINTTQFVGNYLYKTAFTSSLYGYGNAISVIFVIVCLIITVVMNRAFKKDVGEF
ncbi:sugar ABC transporter permease [Paenibacillus sp. 1011MAR3C5]|uniref:carbohydrate ABC transporter permease n=1 Tax=Paenibacillus sp. 1011MAR3C5 TaxID=1675787 RepID=UPI000E6BC236|nr:sugar ABC transporter permease [Paenibacillus sp. 1011MAR3C5]RJE88794.1 sugar ABC transporter permease [Paenibacillus sp. 1011MAR3C5]